MTIFYWVLFCVLALVPFLMFFVEYRAHKKITHVLQCPVWIGMSTSATISLLIAIHFYPSGMGMISIFVFGVGGVCSIAVAGGMNYLRLH